MTAAHVGTLVLGGLAAIESTPIAQTLASQPLVTATILGAIWGDWSTALGVGVVLQIMAASTLPIGARTPEDYSVGGVVGAGVALSIAAGAPFEHVRQAASLTGVMAGMIAATIGVPLLRWQRQWNEGLARWCENALRAGRERALAESQGAAVALAFAIGLAATAAWMALAHGGASLVERESLRLAGAWHLLQPLWLGFGFAQLLHAFVQRRLERAGVFAAALVGAWLIIVAGSP
ncbi:MAG TPA: PTS sugar transporter subunit IIC [Methylomirabilota bacterium]|nr:PTS sugar transporter subunit IIC [Methylomirabilota bacterium]